MKIDFAGITLIKHHKQDVYFRYQADSTNELTRFGINGVIERHFATLIHINILEL